MKFLLEKGGEVEVVLAFKNDNSITNHKKLYDFIKKKEIFKGKEGETFTNLSMDGGSVVFLGLSNEEKLDYEVLRKSFYKLGKILGKNSIDSVGVKVPRFEDLCYKRTNAAIVEGLLQSQYIFDKYKSEKKEKTSLKEVYLDVLEDKKDKVQQAIKEMEIIMEGIFLTRDMVNEPAINMYPKALSKAARENLEDLGVKVDVYGIDEIQEIGMEAFLAVSKGSEKEPQFIVMTYLGDESSHEKIALVGKGLTYDSGGYSLKPSAGMATMHSDMAGSASVIGAMKAIAKSKLKKNVVAIVAACENLISGGAYKPGDIISSMSGKTIEVDNTDAEGRITLADALYYAATVVKAEKIVDLATLTGACVVALGDITTGAITNDESLMNEIKEAGSKAGEYVWQLPSYDGYKELNKSHVADIKNSGGRGAGAITAGLFLQEFVEDKPWVHLDIAGTSFISKQNGYLPKGATGVPVKTLYHFVKES